MGPYKEVAISIPFTLDRATPPFTGILRKSPEVTNLYIRHLPVTTEIARDVGVEFFGYPKFIASIEFAGRVSPLERHPATRFLRPTQLATW